MTRSRFRSFSAAALAALALAVTVAAQPALAVGPSAVIRADAAAGWLARQMTGGSHFVTTLDGTSYPNQGMTIDAIFAFAATGSAQSYGARATAWLSRRHILANYIGNGTTTSYAGATAKVALAAEVRGLNPTSFGGVNLIARLGKLYTPSGRYSDHSKYGDFSNAFSQSLAILALTRYGRAPAKAVAYLAHSECANGGFPLDFAQKACVSDTDATAMDIQALLAAGSHGPAVRGLRWLARTKAADGGLVGAGGGTAPNADSTGLAGEAFAAAGWTHQAALARRFLLKLQVGCSAPARQRGAIDYHEGHFAIATAVEATAQGELGIADIGLASLTSRGAVSDDPRLVCS